MKRLMEYTTPKNMKLYLLAFAVVLGATSLAAATGSNVVLALGFSAAALMWRPMLCDLRRSHGRSESTGDGQLKTRRRHEHKLLYARRAVQLVV